MQDQKIKFWFVDRKKVSKTRIPNRAARKGQFYKPHQLNLYHEVIFTQLQTAIFWNMFKFTTHTLSKLHMLPSYKLVLCLFPPRRKNFEQWTYNLLNFQIWAYHLFSVNALTRYIPPSTQENLGRHSSVEVLS